MIFTNPFLEPSLLKLIDTYINQSWNRYEWRTSMDWGVDIKRFSTPVGILQAPEEFCTPIKKLFNRSIDNKGIMFYFWPPGSYIGWHNDKEYSFGATIYLNKTWDINHGGIFLYHEGNSLKAHKPTYNTCVINNKKTYHCVSITAPDAPIRTTIQVLGSHA
tara:strand:- start:1493 stop:1975 length:483 start_codon:yes stop_codon:yes gene_type:complete